MLTIYDKSEYENISDNELQFLVSELDEELLNNDNE